jgi:hypothetical protein
MSARSKVVIGAVVVAAIVIGVGVVVLRLEARNAAAAPPSTLRAVAVERARVVLHLKDAARIEAPFTRIEDPTAAGGVAIAVPPKAGARPGALALPFTIAARGKYSIWLRAYWGTDGEGACSDSVNVSLDGGAPRMAQDATYETWHWLPLRAREGIELDAGPHTLLFTNREDGIKLDQVFITPWDDDESARCVPQGIE